MQCASGFDVSLTKSAVLTTRAPQRWGALFGLALSLPLHQAFRLGALAREKELRSRAIKTRSMKLPNRGAEIEHLGADGRNPPGQRLVVHVVSFDSSRSRFSRNSTKSACMRINWRAAFVQSMSESMRACISRDCRPMSRPIAANAGQIPVASGLDRASYSNLLVLLAAAKPSKPLALESFVSRLEPALQENFQ